MKMNREEYMKRLERALNGISESEKAEALQYYRDYFDDAGVENEQEVMEALGTPENLAETIKKEQMGQQDSFEQNVELEDTYVGATKENEDNKKKNKLSGGTIAAIVILAILASPIILTVAAAVASALVGVVAAIFSAVVSVIAVVLALILVVVICIVAVFVFAGISPFFSVILAGIALMVAGVCVFLIMAVVWLFGMALPWLIKGIIKLCKKIFGKKGEQQ